MSAQHITDSDFDQVVLKSDKPVLVDFFAEWCGPCQMASPIIDDLAESLKDQAKIVKLDIDENQMTPSQYGVMSIPTMIVFKNGKELTRKVGFGGKSGIESLVNQALAA